MVEKLEFDGTESQKLSVLEFLAIPVLGKCFSKQRIDQCDQYREQSFSINELTEVTVPDGVTSIGEGIELLQIAD